jgi:hypothetical protein
MPDNVTDAADLSDVGPPALERFRVFRPAKIEWIQTTDVTDLYVRHYTSLKRDWSTALI